MNDAESRLAAKFDLHSNMVVEAAAGTGKTSLLIARILSLILVGQDGKGVSLEKIAALTFTNKAAAEMKIRLAQQLHQVSLIVRSPDDASSALIEFIASLKERFELNDDLIKNRAAAALNLIERTPIETFHSFMARILRLYPLEVGLSPTFEIDEGRHFNRIFESEWEAWLDIELGPSAPREKDWLLILKFVAIKDLKELAKELCKEKMPLDLVHQTSKKALESLKSILQKLEKIPEGKPVPRSKAFPAKFSELRNQIEALIQIASQEKEQPPEDSLLSSWNNQPSKPSWPKWPKAWEEYGDEEIIYEHAQKIAELSSPEKQALVGKATRLLTPFCLKFLDSFRRAGFISFDNLLLEARNLLKDNLKIRNEIKRFYHSFLVDEFQDTDPIQGEILFYLAERQNSEERDWEKAVPGPGRIFVVGDPKQSIYRFRGADIAAYQDFTQKILSYPGSKSLSLNLNFRSKAEVLSPINSLFSKTMSEKKGLQAAHQELKTTQVLNPASLSLTPSPKRDEDARPPALTVTSLEIVKLSFSDASALAQEFQQAEARWICRWIKDHCGPQKQFHYKDVAVLWRTQTGSSHLIEALKEAQIPYAAQLKNSLYSSQEFIDFLNLIHVLDNPEDEISLAAIMRSPLTDTRDSNLANPKSRTQDAIALKKILKNLRSRLGRIPLPLFLDQALKETALLPIAARTYHGSQAVSNILKAARLAEEVADQEGLTAREMIERVLEEVKSGEEEGESPLADDSLDCVRLLTIHKAKGLEFPVVFIPRISSAGISNEISLSLSDWKTQTAGFYIPKARAASLNMAWLRISEKERLNHEALRLLYVGLTRAKEKIFLIGDKDFSSGQFSFSEFLSADSSLSSKDLAADSLLKRYASPSREKTEEILISPAEWALKWKNRFDLARAPIRPWSSSPTQTPTNLFEEEDSLPRKNRASLLGQLCHETLKNLNFKNPGDVKKIISAAGASLSQLSLEPIDQELHNEAAGLIEYFLRSAQFKEIIKAEILGREIPFVYREKDALIKGTIDLVYQSDERTVIVDYKTGPAPLSLDEKKTALERYRPQAETYLRAVEKTLGKKAQFQLLFLRRPESPIWYNEKDVF